MVVTNTDPERTKSMELEEFKKYLEERFKVIQGEFERSNNPRQQEADKDSDVYNFKYPKRGLATIFNNVNFFPNNVKDEELTRYGSQDETALTDCFELLGFDVMVFKDLSAKQMQIAAQEAARLYNHDDADCFVGAILSHGDEIVTIKDDFGIHTVSHITYGSDRLPVYTKNIIGAFKNEKCKSLTNKPRLFFIQACRGVKLDDGVTLPSNDTTAKISDSPRDLHLIPHILPIDMADAFIQGEEMKQVVGWVRMDGVRFLWQPRNNMPNTMASFSVVKTRQIPLNQDFLIMYATPPGYVSWTRETGAWFIQELCRFLRSEEVEHISLLKGLTFVSRQVAEYYESRTDNEKTCNRRAMPVVDTMLTRDIFLKRKQSAHSLH